VTSDRDIKEQLKLIILKSLRITDAVPEDLPDDRPLLGGHQPLLGGHVEFDSIDILQLILDIERHFGIKLVKGKFEQEAWLSINTLAATVETRLAEIGR